jgi:hypothetical protein
VLAITRRIHSKAARVRKLTAEVKRLHRELRHDRRELRFVLQRDAAMGIDDARLDAAGHADAIDAVTAHHERGR